MKSYKYKFSERFIVAVLFTAVSLLLPAAVIAEDWPAYMKDNARAGVTSESLDLTDLNEAWVYSAPTPPQVAWDGGQPWDAYATVTQVPMRDFDFALSVTVVGDSVYLGSSVTDSVHCLDARSGAQKWFFTTNGPVRYPPSYYDGKLYFGSDDGCVYCITADSGALVWKYSTTSDTRLIGNNNSLIPMWPIRTGTAVADGKVYFASSLVSWQESYLCSVDALTGTDSGTGLYKVAGGVTPMAAIMISSSKIYLLQGRLRPYVFDIATGSNLGTIGDKSGDGGRYALITPDNYFVYGHGQDHQSGYEVRGDKVAIYPDGRAIAVSADTSYVLTGTSISAINRNSGSAIWSVPYTQGGCLILAGDTLFAGGTNIVTAHSTANGSQLWSKTVKGRVRELAAANEKLFVSTDTGKIYMFGSSYLPADFDDSGTIDLLDLLELITDYLRCSNPTDSACENLSK